MLGHRTTWIEETEGHRRIWRVETEGHRRIWRVETEVKRDKWGRKQSGYRDSLDEIILNLEHKIDKRFTEDDLGFFKDCSKNNPTDNAHASFLPTSKLLMLFFGIKAHNIEDVHFVSEQRPSLVVDDINTAILDGLYPLHLAVFTPCEYLLSDLIEHYGANPNVKCFDANSPFNGMTPLEMALHAMTMFISWTPSLPLFDLISILRHDRKARLLYDHIRLLMNKSVGVRDLFFKFSLDVKPIELGTLLLAALYDNTLSTMYFSTTSMPPEHHFGRPLMLRHLVAIRISLLLKDDIHFKLTAAHHSDEAHATHKKEMMALTSVLKLLESADRGDLYRAFREESYLPVDENDEKGKDKDANEDRTDDVTKRSQDESWVNRYLKTSLIYIDPSLFHPRGFFDSLMPHGYSDSFHHFDGIRITDDSAAELIFRQLNGRKFEELSFEDLGIFRTHLAHVLQDKIRETTKLQAIKMECNRKQTKKLKNLKTRKLRPGGIIISNYSLQTSRTLSTAAASTSSLPVYSSTRSTLLLDGGRMMSGIANGDYEHDPHREACFCHDSKQKKCIEDWSSFPPEELNLIREIIEKDEAAEFKLFLEKLEKKYVWGDVLFTLAGCEVCPYDILGKICHHRAINCATELFSHQVGSMMYLNIQNCHGSYPLHDAAITLSSSLVKLLLERGATPETPVPSQTISSLDYALERLSCDRNLINWNPKKSVLKLIIALCLPQMKEARETIALLVGSATTTDIPKDAIYNAVKRGQVVPVAALLLVAREKVLWNMSFYGNIFSSSPLTFHRAIINELAALINQEYALLGREEHREILQLCLEKKELMMYFLQMLEIFEKAGPELDSYLKSYVDKKEPVTNEEVSRDVAKLLENAGFTLSELDQLDSSLKPETVPSEIEMEEQECEDDSDDIWFRPVRMQVCVCDVKNASCGTSKVFHRLVAQKFVHGPYRGFSSHAGPSAYHHSWTIPPKMFGRVEPLGKFKTTVKEECSKWVSKRVVRSVSVLLAALKRRGGRGV